MFDHDGNLWVGTKARGLFRIHGNAVEHYGPYDGLSGDSVYALFEDREGIVWAGLQAESTAFAIHLSSPSRRWKDWGRIYQRASWPAEMARFGLQTLDRLITL